GVLTNEATVNETEDGIESKGDPTEVALLRSAAAAGIEPDLARNNHPTEADLPFEPERQYSVSVRRYEGRACLFLKGAPERVLDMCDSMLMDGETVPLDREAAHEAAAAMAAERLRVLGVA